MIAICCIEKVITTVASSTTPSPAPAGVILQPSKSTAATSSYQLVMDPRLGVIVGTMTPATGTTQLQSTPHTPTVTVAKPSTINAAAAAAAANIQTRRRRARTSTPATAVGTPTPQTPPTTVVQPQKQTRQTKSATNSPVVTPRPAESTAVGGLVAAKTTANNNVVDLTSEEVKTTADTREVSFNKLQGKTFPSLVVVARPHLRVKDTTGGDRSRLDAKVKAVLMHPPTKFTEWYELWKI